MNGAYVEADGLYPHHINSRLLHLTVTSSFVFFLKAKESEKWPERDNQHRSAINIDGTDTKGLSDTFYPK